MNLQSHVKKVLSKVVKTNDYVLSIPPNPALGDVSSAVAFQIAKDRNPKEVAEEIVKKIKPSRFIKKVRVVGPYINFYFDQDKVAKKVIKEVLKSKKVRLKNKIINLDIYGPNLMKGLHLGHLRNASIGGCLERVLKKAGYKVKTISFASDIGLPVAKVVWGYMNLGLKPVGNKGEWLGTVYAAAHNAFSKSDKVKAQVYDINKKIYQSEPSVMRAYNQLLSLSFDYVKKMADKLRLKIDKYINESETIKPANKVIKLLKKEGLAEKSEGALIVDLKKYGLGVYVLLTKQGVPTYEAKDLSLAFMKKRLFKADKYAIFAGSEQVMHFKQVIKTLELIGFKKGSVVHKPYELVLMDGKKLSSRTGASLMISRLLDDMIDAAYGEVTKKNPKVPEAKRRLIAEEIAMSSLFYGMIKQDMNKTIDFRINDWVRFDGDTGAYIQYSYVRAQKILAGQKLGKSLKITHDAEFELIKKLNEYSSILFEATKRLDAALIARYAFDLATTFSKFYQKCPVLNPLSEARLLIVKAFGIRMKTVMELMGMKPLKEM